LLIFPGLKKGFQNEQQIVVLELQLQMTPSVEILIGLLPCHPSSLWITELQTRLLAPQSTRMLRSAASTGVGVG